MPTIKLPIDETLLSKQLGRSIKSPILVAHLNELDINAKSFLSFFKPFFSRLSWDPYDARRLQVEYLLERFPADQAVLRSRFKDYFASGLASCPKRIGLPLLPSDHGAAEPLPILR